MNITRPASEGCKPFARTLAMSLLFLCLGNLAYATAARVDEAHGDVQIRATGTLEWQPVIPGQKVTEGAAIRTGPNSRAEILTDRGHRFQIAAETTIEFSTLQPDETKTHLESGRVLSKVQKLAANEKFSIQTPTAVCAVRGTEFETTAGDKGTLVVVSHGVVGVAIPGSNDEIRVPAGQMTSVHDGLIEHPRPIPRADRAKMESGLAHLARHEVALDMTRAQVIASAAMERRLADYQEGKSLTDVNGQRVRLQEYIVRPAANQFKLVALDERGKSQLDYFFYLGTFNQNLPTDISVALRQLSGNLGTTAPTYYLTSYEMGQSNTVDSIHDTSTGGHLVKITQDGQGNFILTDPTDPTNTRTVPVVQAVTSNGVTVYEVFNPIADSLASYSTLAQANANAKFGVYITENDTFHDLAPTDTYWKTNFNTYQHSIDNVVKLSYSITSGISNVLTGTQDYNKVIAGGSVTPIVTPDPNNVDATVTNWYGDGTFETYRTVLINDQGSIAPLSAFSGITTGAAYKGELLQWNYEQQVSATEFQGRKIDLVVEPRIFIESGLIQ
jgi:hypothetical protein